MTRVVDTLHAMAWGAFGGLILGASVTLGAWWGWGL